MITEILWLELINNNGFVDNGIIYKVMICCYNSVADIFQRTYNLIRCCRDCQNNWYRALHCTCNFILILGSNKNNIPTAKHAQPLLVLFIEIMSRIIYF